MANQPFLRRFWRDQCGATIIEFAIVSLFLFIMMFGVMEYGLIMMTKVAIESATQQVSRDVAIGGGSAGCDRACLIKQQVQKKTRGLVQGHSVVVTSVVVGSAKDGAQSIPDLCLDTPACTKWQENNGIPGYQKPDELTNAALGKEGQLVEIRVSYPWRVVFPLFRQSIFGAEEGGPGKLFGDNDVLTITSSTVVKNEPFGPTN